MHPLKIRTTGIKIYPVNNTLVLNGSILEKTYMSSKFKMTLTFLIFGELWWDKESVCWWYEFWWWWAKYIPSAFCSSWKLLIPRLHEFCTSSIIKGNFGIEYVPNSGSLGICREVRTNKIMADNVFFVHYTRRW